MRYTSLEKRQSFSSTPMGDHLVDNPQRKLKRIVLMTDDGEQFLNRRKNYLKRWIKIMKWAIISYLPEQQLNRPNARLYFRGVKIDKAKMMNEIAFETSPLHTSSEFDRPINAGTIEISEEPILKRLNDFQDNYLRTLLDEKCLTYPSTTQSHEPAIDNV